MTKLRSLVGAIGIGEHRVSRQREETERTDELLRRFGHRDANLRTRTDQLAHQLTGLVGRDSAAHSQRHPSTFEHRSIHRRYSSAKGWIACATASSWRASERSAFIVRRRSERTMRAVHRKLTAQPWSRCIQCSNSVRAIANTL